MVVRAETTKIEAYNDIPDWVCFGSPVVKSGDPVEQENSGNMPAWSPTPSCFQTSPTSPK
jgi:hypothetical protein